MNDDVNFNPETGMREIQLFDIITLDMAAGMTRAVWVVWVTWAWGT